MTLAGPLTKFVSKFTKMQANAVLKAEVEAILARFEVPSRLLDPMVQRAMVLLHPVVEEEKEETLEEGDGEQGHCSMSKPFATPRTKRKIDATTIYTQGFPLENKLPIWSVRSHLCLPNTPNTKSYETLARELIGKDKALCEQGHESVNEVEL